MNREHEVAVIGGGIAGSTLVIALAGVGARVALIERAAVFNDRVRGEWLAPWCVAESRRLGLASVLRSAGAHEVPWNVSRSGKPRRQATPGGDVPLTFFHPVLQEALLTAAADAGVEVIRPGLVEEVRGGSTPTVTIRQPGTALALRASLVVGADGRGSSVRRLLGRGAGASLEVTAGGGARQRPRGARRREPLPDPLRRAGLRWSTPGRRLRARLCVPVRHGER